jgi:hypothetical protein
VRILLPFVLLAGGFLAYVFAFALLAAGESVRETQTALMIYARTVLIKGLLPQLLLTLALLALALRFFRGRTTLAVIACALVAGLGVAAALLPLDLPRLPAVKYKGAWNFTATVLEMTAGSEHRAPAGLLP